MTVGRNAAVVDLSTMECQVLNLTTPGVAQTVQNRSMRWHLRPNQIDPLEIHAHIDNAASTVLNSTNANHHIVLEAKPERGIRRL